jgi:hypothetical protein
MVISDSEHQIFLGVSPMRPSQLTTQPVTLTVELSNTRTDRGGRLRNRTETYVLGVLNGPGVNHFTPPYDLFSFCCYRALLLGSPGVIIKVTVQPGGRKLLTEPLPPQRLKGEDAVEPRHRDNRVAQLYRMYPIRGPSCPSRFFGYRSSDRGSPTWLRYQPQEVILDPATGAPPTFGDVDDFQHKSQVIGPGGPLTKAQAWSTWLWLLLHKTFHLTKCGGQHTLMSWDQSGILFRGPSLMKHGC